MITGEGCSPSNGKAAYLSRNISLCRPPDREEEVQEDEQRLTQRGDSPGPAAAHRLHPRSKCLWSWVGCEPRGLPVAASRVLGRAGGPGGCISSSTVYGFSW